MSKSTDFTFKAIYLAYLIPAAVLAYSSQNWHAKSRNCGIAAAEFLQTQNTIQQIPQNFRYMAIKLNLVNLTCEMPPGDISKLFEKPLKGVVDLATNQDVINEAKIEFERKK